MTATLSSDTLIHRFTVLPTSFEPSFTHAVALQGDREIIRVTSGGTVAAAVVASTPAAAMVDAAPPPIAAATAAHLSRADVDAGGVWVAATSVSV